MTARVSISTWYRCEGRFPAIAECPKCSGGMLGPDAPHSIDIDGNVEASVVCARPGCDFHAYVKLEQWHGPAVAHA